MSSDMGSNINRLVSAAASGLVFGGGLALAGVTNPAKVLAFFDFFGNWDPSLAFTLGAALAVTGLAFGPARTTGAAASAAKPPLFADAYELPTAHRVDRQLIGGAALFGLGWGLVGFCVGPAVAAMAFGNAKVYVFVMAMIAGLWIGKMLQRQRPHAPAAAPS